MLHAPFPHSAFRICSLPINRGGKLIDAGFFAQPDGDGHGFPVSGAVGADDNGLGQGIVGLGAAQDLFDLFGLAERAVDVITAVFVNVDDQFFRLQRGGQGFGDAGKIKIQLSFFFCESRGDKKKDQQQEDDIDQRGDAERADSGCAF